jgi:integrase
MKLKLDAKTISALALPKGRADEICWDAELEGFGLRLRRRSDGGTLRNWVAQYRANSHTRRATIGNADKITPTQARDAARKLLARVELGHDPQAEKAAKRQQDTRTVRATVAAYLEAKQSELRPASLRVSRLYLTGSYFKALHPLAVGAVTRADVAACVRAIVHKHSGPTAAAARRALSALFAWSIAEGLLGDGANPVDGSHRPDDPTPRDRVLTDAELVAIWNAADPDSEYGRIVRLLMLLGARASEVGGMRWSELDLDADTWTLPAERSKNHRAHTVALPPAALDIIEAVPRTDRDHLFGARAGAGFTSWPWHKEQIDRRLADAAKPWRVHDLRRTVATRMADIGIEPHVIEAALNHYSGHRRGVAGIYNRSSYEGAVAAALERWADHLNGLVSGKKPATVVKLHRRR